MKDGQSRYQCTLHRSMSGPHILLGTKGTLLWLFLYENPWHRVLHPTESIFLDPSLLHCCQHIAHTNFHSASHVLWLHRRASLELALPAWMTWWCTPSYVPVLCHPHTLKHIFFSQILCKHRGCWSGGFHTHGHGIP